jgi:type II secretory pathway component PulF
LRKDYLKRNPPTETTAALASACRNLVDVLEAGGSEAKALNWASRVCLDEKVRQAFLDAEKQVRAGSRLADCKFPPVFTPLFGGLIAAHDAVGSMPTAFKDLAKLLGH